MGFCDSLILLCDAVQGGVLGVGGIGGCGLGMLVEEGWIDGKANFSVSSHLILFYPITLLFLISSQLLLSSYLIHVELETGVL